MEKKTSWFGLVKRLFATKPKTKKDGKKSRGWRWFLVANKPKHYYPTLLASQKTINEAREEQRKQAVAVAAAMAAAAEAAVAAARAASEVVHLTGVPQSLEEYEKKIRNKAATSIQAAYRAHLARKALKALKGLVRLQALVRGRIVRRHIFTKLSCLRCSPPTFMTHPHIVQQIRVPNICENYKDYNKKQVLSLKEELEEERKKLRSNSRNNWDQSLNSKEDMEALGLRKQEASVKRERMKKYSFSHREGRDDRNLGTLISTSEKERWTEQFERKRETSNPNLISVSQLKLKSASKPDLLEELKFPFTLPRRSFCHAKQKSFGDESSLPNSPNFPTYMAATESAKAKIRSTSTPLRRSGLYDNHVDYDSPYKARLSTWSSFNGDFGSSSGKRFGHEQISLSMNGYR